MQLAIEIGDDVEEMIRRRKPGVAFNMGGMGSATTNYYNDAGRRTGYAEDAQAVRSLRIAGAREAAPSAFPTRW